MTIRFVSLVGVLGVCVNCAAEVNNAAFPVSYLPQRAAYDAVPACASYFGALVLDTRATPSAAGTRYSENAPAQRYRIFISGDMKAFIASAFEKAASIAVLRQNQLSNAAISLEVVMLDIEERAKYNSVYDASLVLDVKVVDRQNQSVLWQSRKSGHGHNYGKAGAAINYQETLSRSVEDAFVQLLRDPDFSRALCALNASSGAP